MVLSLSLRARHYSDAECGPEHLGQVRKFSPPVTFNSILTSVELDPEPGTGVRTSAPFMTLTWLISPTPPPPPGPGNRADGSGRGYQQQDPPTMRPARAPHLSRCVFNLFY